MNPKPNKKIVLRSRVLRNNCLEGLFHTVPTSFVLHCIFASRLSQFSTSFSLLLSLSSYEEETRFFTDIIVDSLGEVWFASYIDGWISS